jgi:hypothetical protein
MDYRQAMCMATWRKVSPFFIEVQYYRYVSLYICWKLKEFIQVDQMLLFNRLATI